MIVPSPNLLPFSAVHRAFGVYFPTIFVVAYLFFFLFMDFSFSLSHQHARMGYLGF